MDKIDETAALAALSALGQPTRLGIFRLLVAAGADGVPAGEIAERLGAPQNTVSSHLRIIAQTGLIVSGRDGRIVRYAADMTVFRDLLAYLMEDCCGGHPDLCRPALDAAICRC